MLSSLEIQTIQTAALFQAPPLPLHWSSNAPRSRKCFVIVASPTGGSRRVRNSIVCCIMNGLRYSKVSIVMIVTSYCFGSVQQTIIVTTTPYKLLLALLAPRPTTFRHHP